MAKKKYKSNTINTMGQMGVGLAGAGLTLGVGAAVASKAGVPMGDSFATAASFAPAIVTVGMGGAVLGDLRKLNKSKKRY